jgi:hypothetical protein
MYFDELLGFAPVSRHLFPRPGRRFLAERDGETGRRHCSVPAHRRARAVGTGAIRCGRSGVAGRTDGGRAFRRRHRVPRMLLAARDADQCRCMARHCRRRCTWSASAHRARWKSCRRLRWRAQQVPSAPLLRTAIETTADVLRQRRAPASLLAGICPATATSWTLRALAADVFRHPRFLLSAWLPRSERGAGHAAGRPMRGCMCAIPHPRKTPAHRRSFAWRWRAMTGLDDVPAPATCRSGSASRSALSTLRPPARHADGALWPIVGFAGAVRAGELRHSPTGGRVRRGRGVLTWIRAHPPASAPSR